MNGHSTATRNNLSTVAAAVLIALAPLPSPGGTPGVIECGEVIESSLDPGDTDLGDGTWLESFEFTTSSFSTIATFMTADGFRPYVIITDSESVTLEEGDSPQVAVLLAGSYRLFANNFEVLPAGDYPYALSLSCSQQEVEAIRCGQTVAGQLDPTDEGSVLHTWIDSFAFTIDEAMHVTFRLETEAFDAIVIVNDSEGADLGSGFDQYSLDLAPGDYVAFANNFVSLAVDAYPYRLSMSCGATACPGDCNGDGRVSVAELIRGVRIALGDTDQTCAAFDTDSNGTVTVSELIAAVRAALDNCSQ